MPKDAPICRERNTVCVAAVPVAADGKFFLSPGERSHRTPEARGKTHLGKDLISFRGITHAVSLLLSTGPFK